MSTCDWETLAALLLEDHDGISDTTEANSLAKTIHEIRENDPFLYFSIPGALKYDSVHTKTSAKELASNVLANNNKVARKTRVSCEVYSDIHLIEMMEEGNVSNDGIGVEGNGGRKVLSAQKENHPRKNFEALRSQEKKHKQVIAKLA